MTVSTLERALSMLPSAGFLNLYGQTEAIVSGLPRELHTVDGADAVDALRRWVSRFPVCGCGSSLTTDRTWPVGEPGEIVVRSDSLFRGYWDDPRGDAGDAA